MVPLSQLRIIAGIQVAMGTFGAIQTILMCLGMFAISRRATVRAFVLLSSKHLQQIHVSEYRTVACGGHQPLSEIFARVNNLRHQQGDMQITATVSLFRSMANIMNRAKCSESHFVHKTCPFSNIFNTNAISIHISIIAATLTDYLETIRVTKYKHLLSKCLNMQCVLEARLFKRQTVHIIRCSLGMF